MTELLVALARTGPLAWLGLPIAPPLVRGVLGVVLALAVLPATAALPADAPLLLLLVREATVGLALGLVASIPLRAAEAAGGLIDQARRPRSRGGLAASLRSGYLLFALAAFASLGGPRLWVDALGESYLALPIGRATVGGAAVAIEAVARLLTAAALLCAPALAALLAADLVIGLLTRSAPSLRATGGGRGARDLAGLAMVAASAGALSLALGGMVDAIQVDLAAAVRALAG